MKWLKRCLKRGFRNAANDAVRCADHAWIYLWESYWTWASTNDRGDLTEAQWEALHLLDSGIKNAFEVFTEAA